MSGKLRHQSDYKPQIKNKLGTCIAFSNWAMTFKLFLMADTSKAYCVTNVKQAVIISIEFVHIFVMICRTNSQMSSEMINPQLQHKWLCKWAVKKYNRIYIYTYI